MIGEVIRGFIGFDGVLMSDDVSMGALSGSIGERTRASLAAGCDVVLHCNGRLDEMQGGCASRRRNWPARPCGGPKRRWRRRRAAAGIDLADARREFAAMMA